VARPDFRGGESGLSGCVESLVGERGLDNERRQGVKAQKNQSWVMWYLSAGFSIMIVLVWAAELSDLPQLVFGGDPQKANWRGAAVETLLLLVVWAFCFLLMRRLVSHLLYLEGLLRVCSWCGKVHYKGKWLSLDKYFAEGFHVQTSHGLCPECFKNLNVGGKHGSNTDEQIATKPGRVSGEK
jgi:hypothetical protein